jgi:autotransporter-associated beta strand protein
MKLQPSHPCVCPLRRVALFLGLTLCLAGSSLHAVIVAPYSVDADTLHLWHFDETATPVINYAPNGTNLTALGNGATLGNASFPGFGTALSTYDGGPDGIAATDRDAYLSARTLANSTADNVSMSLADPETGAFTFEAIVYIDFDPTLNYGSAANGGNGRAVQMMILTGEDEVNAGRVFQFRLEPIGTLSPFNSEVMLKFNNLNGGSSTQPRGVPVPITGADAIAMNRWYHVAVTYNGLEGTPDGLKFYWTLMDPSRTEANLIGVSDLSTDLPTSATDFCIGNTGRNPPNANFAGLIDEVRISKVARPAEAMVFGTPEVKIIANPADLVLAVGQTGSFNVSAAGQAPLAYQWWHNSSPIPGATESLYNIGPVAQSDAGEYFVVVTNDINARTSSVATLTVRTPLNLVWNPSASFDWNTTDFNWIRTDTSASVPFLPGDHVTFNSQGSFSPNVVLAGVLTPNSVIVDADTDYTLTTAGSGTITGTSSLLKRGSGKLVIDTDNSFEGPTTIDSGILQVGAGESRGSLGYGPITNHSAINFSRTGALVITNEISGSGNLTNNSGTVTLSGSNSYGGATILLGGNLILAHPNARGSSQKIGINPGSQLTLSGPMHFGADVSIEMAAEGVGDVRGTLSSAGDSNSIAGPILLKGSPTDGMGTVQITVSSGQLHLLGGLASENLADKLLIRGGGTGHIFGHFNVPNARVIKTDGGTWILHSTGNACNGFQVAAGTLRLGVDHALPITETLLIGQASGGTATFDLAGHDQQVSALMDNGSGTRRIANSSTTNDSLLSVVGPEFWSFGGVIQDAIAGGTRKVSLSVTGATFTLGGSNTYSGETILSGGMLSLAGEGGFSLSSRITLVDGVSVYAASRYDGTWILEADQTLRCAGAINVVGNLETRGTIELGVTKAGALVNDSISGASQITYGGTLKLLLGGGALSISDTIKLFDASGYAGAFASIVPAAPGSGLAWDASTLAIDGVLRLTEGPTTPPTVQSSFIEPDQLVLAASGGIAGTAFYVLASEDIGLPLSSWKAISTNVFDSQGMLSVTNQINPGVGRQFFILKLP